MRGTTERIWHMNCLPETLLDPCPDVRWNKKKGIWKVAASGEMSGEEDVRDDQVSASRIREQLTQYENTFWTFPHEALMRMSVDSRTASQEAADQDDVQASIDALLKTMPKNHQANGAGAGASGAPQFYDQLLAISGDAMRLGVHARALVLAALLLRATYPARIRLAGMVDRDLKNIKDSKALEQAASPADAGAGAGALGRHSAKGGARGGEDEDEGVADARRLVMDWAIEHVVGGLLACICKL